MNIETIEEFGASLPPDIYKRINQNRSIYFRSNPPRLQSCEEIEWSRLADYFDARFCHSRAKGGVTGHGLFPWHTLPDYDHDLRSGTLARLHIMGKPNYLVPGYKDYVFPEPQTTFRNQDDFQGLLVAGDKSSQWRHHLLKYLNGLIDLTIAGGPGISNYDCQLIVQQPELIYLDLYKAGVDDQGLQLLSKLKNLRILDICEENDSVDDIGITAGGYSCLSDMEYLTQLKLSGCFLNEDSMKQIGQLRNLEYLKLTLCTFSQSGFKYLSNLKNLETLDLWGCKNLSKENIVLIADLVTLKELVLPDKFDGNITEATKCFADHLPNLEYLTIYIQGQYQNLLLLDTLNTLPNLSDLKVWKKED